MAISPWTKPLDMKIAPLPFEALAYGYEKRAKKEEEADKLYSDLEGEFAKIGALPVDTPERNRIIQEYRDKLSSMYDQNRNNPSSLVGGFKQVQRDFIKELNYGKLGGIYKRHQGYLESAKEKSDYVSSYVKTGKGLTDEEAQQTLNHELSVLNANPIEQTPYGNWQSYSTKSVVPHVEVQKVALELGEKIKPEELEAFSGLKSAGKGYLYNEKTGTTELAAPYIAQMVRNTMMTMPEINSFLDFKHTVSGNKDAWVKEATQNPYGLLSRDGTQSVEPNEWFARQYYNDVENAANNAGNLLQQRKITKDRDYMKDWLMEKSMDETPVYGSPLNIPLMQANNSVINTLSELNSAAVPGRYGLRDVPGRPRSGYNEFIGTEQVVIGQDDWMDKYNNFSPVTKQRVEYVKKTIPGLANKSPLDFTVEERKQVIDALREFENRAVSAQMFPIQNSKAAVEEGKKINRVMENFVFFDVNNVIGTNPNRMYSGSELRQAGFSVDEKAGEMSTSNIIPTKIAGQTYTFAKPTVVNASKGDKSIGGTFYMGVNKAQIDEDYLLSALENNVTTAINIGVPMPLFDNPNIVIIPKDNYSYDIMTPKGNISIQGNTPTEFRNTLIRTIFKQDPSESARLVQEALVKGVFGEE